MTGGGADFGSLLRAAAEERTDAVFLRDDAELITFGDLEERSARVATALLGMGLQAGDRVAIAALNQAEWLYTFFGAVRIGLVVVTLNVRYRERELEYMLNHSGARVLVTQASLPDFDFRDFYRGFRGRVSTVEEIVYLTSPEEHDAGANTFDRLLDQEPDRAAVSAAERAAGPDRTAVILYTSGTTGTPKGATLTHRSMIAAGAAQNAHLGLEPTDVALGVMPFNHVGGITCTITAALLARSSVVLMRAFSPQHALAAMAGHGVTVAAGVPTMYSLMLAQPEFAELDVSAVRVAIVGGANADPTLCAAISKGFPSARLTNLYGLSECSGACVLSAPDDGIEQVSATLGVPSPGVRARVVDLDGREVDPGKDGELQISGGGVAAGYWRMPDETSETFLPDGWLATGDMVSMSADGHISLRGRRKEMFLQGGYNVYPVEVENVLTAHPGVAMAAGIGVPDSVLGEVGRYYVVPRQDAPAPGREELVAFCRDLLADYKVPRQVAIVDELPLTPAGKVAKAQLRAEYLEESDRVRVSRKTQEDA